MKTEEGAISQEIPLEISLSENEQGKETDSPLRASRRKQSCQHLDFSVLKLILDFLSPEL